MFSGFDVDTTVVFSGLPAGNYLASASDSSGHLTSAMFTIESPDPIEIVATINHECMSSMDGSINLYINGGTAPYVIYGTMGTV